MMVMLAPSLFPAKAGTGNRSRGLQQNRWIPACAGMTTLNEPGPG